MLVFILGVIIFLKMCAFDAAVQIGEELMEESPFAAYEYLFPENDD